MVVMVPRVQLDHVVRRVTLEHLVPQELKEPQDLRFVIIHYMLIENMTNKVSKFSVGMFHSFGEKLLFVAMCYKL